MPRPKKVVKAKEPVRIRFKELQNGNKSSIWTFTATGSALMSFSNFT